MRYFLIIIIVLATLGYIFFVGLNDFRNQALTSADRIAEHLRAAKKSLFDFQPGNASGYFSQIKDELNRLSSQLPAFSQFIPLLKNLPPIFTNLTQLTTAAENLSGQLELLKKEGGQWIINQQGEKLIASLKEIRQAISSINDLTNQLKDQAQAVRFDLGKEINDISPKLYAAGNFLDVFISWLDADQPRQLAIIFQNPSEIRPAGGFIGSFALATINKGGLANLEVNDIYDIDGQLTIKIVPPKPLQTITTDWGARDANWFFDFPASAKKIMEFLEASKIYQERDLQFDGVVAINISVLEDILRIVGPLVILNDSEGSKDSSSTTKVGTQNDKLTITADNFLAEIQRDVETDQNKDILKQLTPILFEKIGQLQEEQKKKLVEAFRDRIENKDVMVYLNDLILESFVQQLGIGGEIAPLPSDFFGEYLAVVNANIAGGKSDAFINQEIKLASHIGDNGDITNNLTVTRTHSGEKEKDSWYRQTNQDFIQILTLKKSTLTSMSGGQEKEIPEPINYLRKKYRVDADLATIENGDYFGRTVFSAWLNTPASQNAALQTVYTNPSVFDLIRATEPQPYQFIFDKQSGVRGGLEFSIEAPSGFVWQESGGPYFIYKNPSPPTRVIIDLQLIKL